MPDVVVSVTVRFLLLLIAILIGVVPPVGSPRAFGADTLIDPDVLHRVLQEGRVRVIAEMQLARGGHISEGLLSHAGINAQRSDIAMTRAQIVARLARRSHRVLHAYETVPLVALELGPDGVQELAAASFFVRRVVIDTLNAPSLPQSVPLIGAGQAWSSGFDGSGTIVAIVDTGVQASHPFLTGKVVEEACYSSNLCPNGQSQQIGPGAGVNCSVNGCWHGTHVAGIAAGNGAGAGVSFSGVAKGADIMAVQVFSRFDSASSCGSSPVPCVLAYTSDIIAGLERVYAVRGTRNIAAANLSLGGGTFTTACDTDPTKAIIDNLRAAGIATVVASGNNGRTNAISSPACVSTAISVGATTKSDVVSSFSNVSSRMSLFAPGESIQSSVVPGGFGYASGTSMATPHVTGAWALLKDAATGASVDQILSALQSTGVAITDRRSGGTVTKPRINVASALTALNGTTTTTTLSVSPGNTTAGAPVTATWSGIAAPTTMDWIGLYALTASDTQYLAWIYVSCSQAPGAAGIAAGSCSFPLPASLATGSFELRLFTNNGYTRLAKSGTFTVSAPNVTLSESPATAAPGSSVSATWSGIAAPMPKDWVGLYSPGAADTAFVAWIYVSCSQVAGMPKAAGSCPLALPSGLASGTYELRVLANDGYTRLGTSNQFTVTP